MTSTRGLTPNHVQTDYLVRRTGLNRLCIFITSLEPQPNDPRLVFQGMDALLIHDDRNAVLLPGFPVEYAEEIRRSQTILIGEREAFQPGQHHAAASFPVQRFYEAGVAFTRQAGKAQKAANQ